MNLSDMKENVKRKIGNVPKTLNQKGKKMVASGLLALTLAGGIASVIPERVNAANYCGPAYPHTEKGDDLLSSERLVREEHCDYSAAAQGIAAIAGYRASEVRKIKSSKSMSALIAGATAYVSANYEVTLDRWYFQREIKQHPKWYKRNSSPKTEQSEFIVFRVRSKKTGKLIEYAEIRQGDYLTRITMIPRK